MKYLMIENQGEVIAEAFTLIGASTKRNDSETIGMFGSGNKYALAFFLRNNYGVRIFSGDRELKIEAVPTTFADQTLGVIHVDGAPTSITTEMGPQWTLWQAIREVYSNALDEGKATMEIVEHVQATVNEFDELLGDPRTLHPEGQAGATRYYIPSDEKIEAFMDEKKRYFADDDDVKFLFKNSKGKILKKVLPGSVNVYRKGIRCLDADKTSLYDYDFKVVSINESRVATSESMVKAKAWALWSRCDLPSVINDFLGKLNQDVWENNEYVNYWSTESCDFNDAWRVALKGKYICPSDYGGYIQNGLEAHTHFIPMKLYKTLIDKFGDHLSAIKMVRGEVDYELAPQDGLTKNTIEKAINFFNECNYAIIEPVQVVRVMGKASNNTKSFDDGATIFINVDLIDDGVQTVAVEILRRHICIKRDTASKHSQAKEMVIEMLNYMKRQNSINL